MCVRTVEDGRVEQVNMYCKQYCPCTFSQHDVLIFFFQVTSYFLSLPSRDRTFSELKVKVECQLIRACEIKTSWPAKPGDWFSLTYNNSSSYKLWTQDSDQSHSVTLTNHSDRFSELTKWFIKRFNSMEQFIHESDIARLLSRFPVNNDLHFI